jgi:hypothetical protein
MVHIRIASAGKAFHFIAFTCQFLFAFALARKMRTIFQMHNSVRRDINAALKHNIKGKERNDEEGTNW